MRKEFDDAADTAMLSLDIDSPDELADALLGLKRVSTVKLPPHM